MLQSSTGFLPSRMLCYGAGGTGSQVAFDLQHQAGPGIEFMGYIDDVRDPRRIVEPGLPIYSFAEALTLEDVGVVLSVHDPALRRTLYQRLVDHGVPILGSRGLPHLVHPQAVVGTGSFISSTTRLALSTRLGDGVIGLADMIAHDVTVGDFSTLAFGSRVLGHVQIGRDVFIGAGAIIKNGTINRPLVIGDGARVDAGAIVGRDVRPGQTVSGPGALSIRRWSEILAARPVRA
ncbi:MULTISPECIES: hypothetical protein [unclassified Leucobacter]|uniref:hypothetical protein n=1 Tax=unclassified Leucobacter TaxID=2621730 RepID=UPI00165EB244|nr:MULTISPECIES: hypothetical protein [unclassified Leucobacter]MBC9936444.1 hypothetical protein [Leucobacter sp. cx-87]